MQLGFVSRFSRVTSIFSPSPKDFIRVISELNLLH
ncbi:hypothetical protein BAE44_0020248, partial [Dichanthelium oligosanthes]